MPVIPKAVLTCVCLLPPLPRLQAVALGAAVQAGIYEGQVRSQGRAAKVCHGIVVLPCKPIFCSGLSRATFGAGMGTSILLGSSPAPLPAPP